MKVLIIRWFIPVKESRIVRLINLEWVTTNPWFPLTYLMRIKITKNLNNIKLLLDNRHPWTKWFYRRKVKILIKMRMILWPRLQISLFAKGEPKLKSKHSKWLLFNNRILNLIRLFRILLKKKITLKELKKKFCAKFNRWKINFNKLIRIFIKEIISSLCALSVAPKILLNVMNDHKILTKTWFVWLVE